MAHAIYNEKFASVKLPAWHRLGTVYQDQISTTFALDKMGDFEIKQWIAGFWDNDCFNAVDGSFFIGRDGYVFGSCSAHYGFLQNMEIARKLDSLPYPLETLGFLHEGATMFATFSYGEMEVLNEHVKRYLLFQDTRDGKHSAKMSITDTRVVCANTLGMANRNARISIDIPHSTMMESELDFRVDIIKAAHMSGDNAETALKEIAKITITQNQVSDIIARVLPLNNPPRSLQYNGSAILELNTRANTAKNVWEKKNESIKEQRSMIAENYTRICDEFPAIANTGWGLFNAFTENSTHQQYRSSLVRAREDVFGKGVEFRDRAYAEIMRG